MYCHLACVTHRKNKFIQIESVAKFIQFHQNQLQAD